MSSPTTTRPHRREDEFTGERHVFDPHSVGLPPLRSYVHELWRRREFAVELARTKLREQNFDTAFGQLWLVLNPLLMALVYFILVDILRASDSRNSEFFAHLVAGLFAVPDRAALADGRRAVGDQGRPADPQLGVPARAAAAVGRDHGVHALPAHDDHLHPDPLCLGAAGQREPALGACRSSRCFLLTASGLAMLVAAAQVYFRDLSNFLPYVLRIWLYVSPVLYYADEVPQRYKWMLEVNPLAGLLTAWSDVLNAGHAPDAGSMLLRAWPGGRDLHRRRAVLPLPGA